MIIDSFFDYLTYDQESWYQFEQLHLDRYRSLEVIDD